METYYRYFTIASISIAVLYLAYFALFRKETDFRKIRLFVLSALLFSLLLPLSPASINITDYLVITKPKQVVSDSEDHTNLIVEDIRNENNPIGNNELNSTKTTPSTTLNINQLIVIIYFLVAGLMILRLLFSIAKMLHLFINAEKKRHDKYTLILMDKRIIAFSFFNWIFIDKLIDNEELKQIIAHEKAHADQYHTIDLLFSELLVAAMWFNPFVWMFKKALTQVHEYLADERVLTSGCNKLEYQRLLVNQAAEERLVAVSSNFSYSLIKKRMMMMQKTKTHGRTGFKFLVIVPIIAVLIFGVACFNQPGEARSKIDAGLNVPTDTIPETDNANNELVADISPTKMNVFYIGVDNPVSIAVTGAQSDKIKVSISNGTISRKNGQYIVRVKQLGKTIITVILDNKVISRQEFRIKTVPDPIVRIKGIYGTNTLTKKELIDAEGIDAILQNFDFDFRFQVVAFSVSANVNGKIKEVTQNIGWQFSKEQINLIQKSTINEKVYVENIKVVSPDGRVRLMGPIGIKIK